MRRAVAQFVAKYAGRQAPKITGQPTCDTQPIGTLPPSPSPTATTSSSATTTTTTTTTSTSTAAKTGGAKTNKKKK